MEERLREILEERKNFMRTECLVDSLVRIDDEECSCRGCIWVFSKMYESYDNGRRSESV